MRYFFALLITLSLLIPGCTERATDGESYKFQDHTLPVNERVDDPTELLRRAEAAIGMMLEGLQLKAMSTTR